MEFIIDRSKWVCGTTSKDNRRGQGATMLENEKGFMCCLGQTCKQLGVDSNDILNLGEPSEIDFEKYNNFPEIFWNVIKESHEESFFENSMLANSAIEINDDPDINQKKKERQLRELFKEYGHKIKFINKSISKIKMSSITEERLKELQKKEFIYDLILESGFAESEEFKNILDKGLNIQRDILLYNTTNAIISSVKENLHVNNEKFTDYIIFPEADDEIENLLKSFVEAYNELKF